MSAETNGAMPATAFNENGPDGYYTTHYGYTKREEFARAAMQGVQLSLGVLGGSAPTNYEQVAHMAVMQADALLEELAKKDAMSANPIDEAVARLEALQEQWCASTAGKPGTRRIATFDAARGAQGEDDFDNEVSATRRCASDLALAIERIRAITAAQQPDHIVDATKMVAQQQGQAVATVRLNPMRGKDDPHKIAYLDADLPAGTKLYTAPPSAPVGVGYAKRLATSLWQQHYREDAPQWEPCEDLMGLLSQIDNMVSGLTRATQQPAADCTCPHQDAREPDHDVACPARLAQQPAAGDGVVTIDGRRYDVHIVRTALLGLASDLATQHQEPTT